MAAGYLHIFELLFRMSARCLEFRNAIDSIDRERVPVNLVVDCQFHRSIDVAAFFVSSDVKIAVVRPVIREFVNQPRITMKVEDDRFVCRE